MIVVGRSLRKRLRDLTFSQRSPSSYEMSLVSVTHTHRPNSFTHQLTLLGAPSRSPAFNPFLQPLPDTRQRPSRVRPTYRPTRRATSPTPTGLAASQTSTSPNRPFPFSSASLLPACLSLTSAPLSCTCAYWLGSRPPRTRLPHR
jgi:hypothetical protein